MIVVIKKDANEKSVENLITWLENQGLRVNVNSGIYQTVLGLIGDTHSLNAELIGGMDIVERVQRISEPYKNANRKFHTDDTIVDMGGQKIGGGNFQFIAGPCSVESSEQICGIAQQVHKAGANLLRGGAFKPRTSPYSFQGLRDEGIEFLLQAKELTGMPVVTEIMNANHLPMFEQVDVIQVGARNMQNFELLKELGRQKKPILLKRGLANTLEELLMSAEYIMSEGNTQIILCERGIRTFETSTRNTLDISAVPMLKRLTHLPVIIDPSHAAGDAALVYPLSMAAAAAGADGLIIEVHNDPAHALCDGPQSIKPDAFASLANDVEKVLAIVNKKG
ncbi:MAG: 3-deoxy-7-phosphoheptulonate synthase [Spirochaetes bacterium]|nr:3-deoxy-7-phosphoheptulonate synthase [Brevinematales bacterium]MCL1959311.1 3-deoxy-7-phosphoheptulonate synthase [Spirochaetota bacterium]